MITQTLSLVLSWLGFTPGPPPAAPKPVWVELRPLELYLDTFARQSLFGRYPNEGVCHVEPHEVLQLHQAYRSWALISGESSRFPTDYAVGDSVLGLRVAEILPERVTLEGNGRRWELRPTEDTLRQVTRDQLRQLVDELSQRRSTALLYRGPDGEFDGVRVSAMRRHTLPAQMGFANGDVLEFVDGVSLRSYPDLETLLELPERSRFCVRISRRGCPREMCYTVR